MAEILYQKLKLSLAEWREHGYPVENYPAISEILSHATLENGALRYLRKAQQEALETYWYIRLVLGTPHISELYEPLHTLPIP